MSAEKLPLAVSDSVSSRVSRALRKAASKRLSGFTLAELIVVIAILAVLATIAFLALSGYTEDARDAKAKANVRTVHSAISAESALTGNSPRYYVAHDPDYALSGAYLYVDGNPVALTGGNVGEAPSDSNYTAGTPRWDRLKLDGEKFRTSGTSARSRLADAFLPGASAAFDKTALSAWAADVPTAAAGKVRTVSFFQIAGILPDTGAVVVSGDFPAPSADDLAAAESNGKPATNGLVRNPDAGPTEALADSSSVSAPAGASCGATVHGGTKTFWTAESVPHGQTCPAGVEFSCDDGTWTHESADKAAYPSEVACVVWTPANCPATTVDGYSLANTNHGDPVTGTKSDTSFLNGTKNLSQNFLCSNGTFAADGAETGTIASCNEGYESNGTSCLPKSCDLPWGGTLAHGQTAQAFQSATVTAPATCTQETRTCNLGVLSGSYTNQACSVTTPAYVAGTAYTAGQTFTYVLPASGETVTVTVQGTGVGIASSVANASCTEGGVPAKDIAIWGTTGNPQIWSACNLQASNPMPYANMRFDGSTNDVDVSTAQYSGGIYQWGNNADVRSAGTWSSTANANNDAWGNTTDSAGNNPAARQWPCPAGYHVPNGGMDTAGSTYTAANNAWNTAYSIAASAGAGTSCDPATVTNQFHRTRCLLRLPRSGYRNFSDGSWSGQGSLGFYWSSSPSSSNARSAYFLASGGSIANLSNRANGFSVRCLKH